MFGFLVVWCFRFLVESWRPVVGGQRSVVGKNQINFKSLAFGFVRFGRRSALLQGALMAFCGGRSAGRWLVGPRVRCAYPGYEGRKAVWSDFGDFSKSGRVFGGVVEDLAVFFDPGV